MNDNNFQYGPLAKGVFIALVYCGFLVPNYFPEYTTHYVIFILFLVFGLKPLLIHTGLSRLYEIAAIKFDDFRYKKITQQREIQESLKRRDAKYRHSRIRDERLPKNW